MEEKGLIEFSSVDFNYDGSAVLKDINFKIKNNEFLGIVGPNGAGKTTLLKLIVGLLEPDSGKINRYIDKIGYISQIQNVNWDIPITVFDVVLMGRYKWNKKIKKNDREKTEEYLKKVDMYKFKDRHINELSGGQKQKVFLARALVREPKLLILDEPNTGVDTEATDKFYDLLTTLKKDHEKSIVLVTHQIEVIPKICDRVGCINKNLYVHKKPENMLKCPVFEKGYGTKVEMLIHGKSIPHRVVRHKDEDENV